MSFQAFLIVFFEAWKVLVLLKFSLSILYFILFDIAIIPQKPVPNSGSWRFTSVFSFMRLKSSYLVNFWCVFRNVLYVLWSKDPTSLYCMWLSNCPYHLLKRLFFSSLNCLSTLIENQLTIIYWFISVFSVLFHWSHCLFLCQSYTPLIIFLFSFCNWSIVDIQTY